MQMIKAQVPEMHRDTHFYHLHFVNGSVLGACTQKDLFLGEEQ